MVGLTYPRSIAVPTDDSVVKRQLRDLDEPMCYFGEGPAERRDRLTKLVSKLDPGARLKLQESAKLKAIESNQDDQIFYYEGGEKLKEARYLIADYSVRQCSYRLDMARIKQADPLSTTLIPQQDLVESIREIEDMGTFMDEEISSTELKTLTSCNLNRDATLMATSCRSGKCKLWSIPDMETKISYKTQPTNANFITFSPKSGQELEPSAANLASCSMDGSITMWNLTSEQPVCQLSGPQDWRVTRVRYHPCGQYLASCCSDKSWRLWDLASEFEILHQEGHSDGVFDISFHPDGSLAASAGLDSYGRVWDLRTGRSIYLIEGHTNGLRSIDFSPDGYHLATGSMDNSVKIWNLRKRCLEYTLPAHVGPVTTVMFEKTNGYYLATSSFDKTVKFWSTKTWAPIKSIEEYDDKVTKIDISQDNKCMVSCHFKYIKLWMVNKR